MADSLCTLCVLVRFLISKARKIMHMDSIINAPPHYVESRTIQPITVLEDWFGNDPLLWQVGKYISRAGRKGDAVRDIQKAVWYLVRRLDRDHPGPVATKYPVDVVLADWGYPADSHLGIALRELHLHVSSDGQMYSHLRNVLSNLIAFINLTDNNTGSEDAYPTPLTFSAYEALAVQTVVFPDYARLYYPALGLCGEAGEVAEKVKKLFRDNNGNVTSEFKHALTRELGDVLWYIAALCRDIGVSVETCALENVNKLRDRAARGALRGTGDER